MSWIDVHTHLDSLEISPELAIQEAEDHGVVAMITIGTSPDDLPVVLALAQKHAPKVVCTLGIHPHEAELYTPEIEAWIRENALRPEVVAIGETGLDYYYNKSPKDVQIAAFRSQLEIARDLKMPVEIHTRDAEADTMAILKEYRGQNVGLLHCFTGSWELAEVGLDCGFIISISGVVTFKNAEALREVVRKVPLDRLHVETDAPFLAPMPHRGKKNQPAYVVHTAQWVADLKGVSMPSLASATRANAIKLFPKFKL